MGVCQPVVGGCEVRVGIDGLQEVLGRLPLFVVPGASTFCPGGICLEDMRPAPSDSPLGISK